ncbi:hypothetical protein F4779DRAFT_378242 [Xylariaceae sp. FL0662B]|nr:hypothetical protein F4779DRAFT_378242 [Xylariaceae sp. FL0662B]
MSYTTSSSTLHPRHLGFINDDDVPYPFTCLDRVRWPPSIRRFHVSYADPALTAPREPPPFCLWMPPEEVARRAAEAAWRAEQVSYYAMPGAPYVPRRPTAPARPGLVQIVARRVAESAVVKAAGAAREKARLVREKGPARVGFWVEETRYRVREAWHGAVPVLQAIALIVLWMWMLGFAALWVAERLLVEREEEIIYVLVENYRSWSVAR